MDRRNSVPQVAGLLVTAQTTNPIALGDSGIWNDGSSFHFIKTDGSSEVIGGAGAVWYSGTAAPSDATGNDGDMYLRTSTGDIYQKASGTWGSALTTFANATNTLAMSNKTLTAPVINGATSASGNFDLSGSSGTFKTTTGAGTFGNSTSTFNGSLVAGAGFSISSSTATQNSAIFKDGHGITNVTANKGLLFYDDTLNKFMQIVSGGAAQEIAQKQKEQNGIQAFSASSQQSVTITVMGDGAYKVWLTLLDPDIGFVELYATRDSTTQFTIKASAPFTGSVCWKVEA